MRLQKLSSAIKGFIFAIRNDPETVPVLRTLVLGLILSACAFYTGVTVLLAPEQKNIKEVEATHKALLLSAPGITGEALVQNIPHQKKEIQDLKEKIAINSLKETILAKQWQILSNTEEFTKAVFTLHQSAPLKIGDNLLQIEQLEPQPKEAFTIYPMKINGETDFATLFSYLQHLETSSTISMIDNLVIEKISDTNVPGARPIHFDLVIGRIGLESK